MKAVVVGGNGFIGSHLVDALLADSWKVVVYDRYPERYRLPRKEVEYVFGDLGNVGLLASVLARTDVVFHLASTTIPESSNDAPEFDIQSNLIGTVGLLKACVETRVGKIVFISTGGAIYGIPSTLPISEEHPQNPVCSYAIVKLAIEKYLYLFHHLYNLSYTILRPSNPYGTRQNPHGNQGVIAVFLGQIAQGLPVTIWGDGSVVRDFFHVADLAQACLKAATTQTSTNVFNIAQGRGVSLNQLLSVMKSVVDKPFHVIRQPARSFDVPELILDVRAAKRELDWEANISLEEGIVDTWQWIGTLKWLDVERC